MSDSVVNILLDYGHAIGLFIFASLLLARFIMDKRGLLSQSIDRRESKVPDAHEAIQNMIRDDISNSFLHPGTAMDFYHFVDNGLGDNKHNE